MLWAEPDIMADVGASDRRRKVRFDVALPLTLERLNPEPGEGTSERTLTEDLGPGGARVPTSLPIGVGERLLLDVPGVCTLWASVQGMSLGDDGVPRVSLAFLDAEAADHVWQILDAAGLS
jgi:hypothetical protein